MHHVHRFFLISITLAAAPASGAGIQMTELNISESGQSRSEILVQGDRFKVSYSEAPLGMPPGCYIVGTGPGMMFIVAPSRSAYARFDKGEFSGMGQKAGASGGANEMPGGMTRTIEDFLLKKELDEAAPAMFGLSTRHYRYLLSYKEVMKMPGMPMAMATKVTEIHEFWSTTDLADAVALSTWQDNAPSSPGNDVAGMNAEAGHTMDEHGMKLKSIVTRKAASSGMGGMSRMMGGGKGDNSVAKREIVAFARVDAPADAFVLPTGFEETDMMGLFMSGRSRMPDLNSSPGTPTKPRKGMPDLNATP